MLRLKSRLVAFGSNVCRVRFSYIAKDGSEIPVVAKVGQNLLRVAQRNDVELEGACECIVTHRNVRLSGEILGWCLGECSIACSTCHVILEPEVYDVLEEPTEDEEDMLDMAFGLTETYVFIRSVAVRLITELCARSRLGCQVLVQEEMEGMKVVLPKATRNFYVDGHVPQPH